MHSKRMRARRMEGHCRRNRIMGGEEQGCTRGGLKWIQKAKYRVRGCGDRSGGRVGVGGDRNRREE